MDIELERPPAPKEDAEAKGEKEAPPTPGVCAIHNLRFDPTQHAGCVLCRRPAQRELDLSRLAKPAGVVLLVGVVIFLIARHKKPTAVAPPPSEASSPSAEVATQAARSGSGS